MKYISGVHALNLPCSLETTGDWHQSSLDWDKLLVAESSHSFFGDYGIEKNHKIPNHKNKYNVANTIRAILDLMLAGETKYLNGFRDDFICTDIYDNDFFRKVLMLKKNKNWKEINELMYKEYKNKWCEFLNKTSA